MSRGGRMKILLVNPSYQTFTSNFGVGHQVPLGLLMVGGALMQSATRHEVKLVDAEALRMSDSQLVREMLDFHADAVLMGHAGSTPAHDTCMRTFAALKACQAELITIYGGVYPTYHPRRILRADSPVDFIVRGEGEETAVALVEALSTGTEFALVPNIAYRDRTGIELTPDAPPIDDLDTYSIGWDLIENWDLYQCGGLGRAVIVQLSRGCPHRCTYCGQHGFWKKWRHRDPVKLVDEIAWLCRERGVRFITLADENTTTIRSVWNRFLEELARRRLPVHFFTTIRASDIVREKDHLPLWRKAGILYVLMGIESTDEDVIKQINKRSTTRIDFDACRLLRDNGILSVLGHIVGLVNETPSTFRTARRQLALYGGDFLNAMYVTPHTWTTFGDEMAETRVIQEDQTKWDYRHQILQQGRMSPGRLFANVKWLEAWFHLRPSKILSMLRQRDPLLRQQYRCTMAHTSMVWLAEIAEFVFRCRFTRSPKPLSEYTDPAVGNVLIRQGPLIQHQGIQRLPILDARDR